MHSIVEYFSGQEGNKCGYCKSPNTNFSHGMWAHALTVSDYQDLIDRGWRRSGKYCYKPTMDVTCCPMYTIRCKALEFKATKSQKKVLKRFNKYLLGPDNTEKPLSNADRKMSTCSSLEDNMEHLQETRECFVEPTRKHQNIDVTNIVIGTEESDELNVDHVYKGDASAESSLELPEDINQKDLKITCSGPDPTRAPCKKAKQIRRERKLEKLKEKGIDITTVKNTNKNKEKQIEDFINDLPDDIIQKLEIRLVRTTPPSSEWLATAKETHQVYVKYQTVIHNDKPQKCQEEKFQDFLVKSPLLEEKTETGPPCGYGSFHQQYRLDGKLIAVGVIDILPKCVSSVYFFYDPEYMNLTLGTYGALREIEFTRRLNSMAPELKYYYMGFYIHSCIKMRYKGNFFPSDLLCPETYQWFNLKDCIPKFESRPYSRLDTDIDNIDGNYPTDKDINYIPVSVRGNVCLYKTYRRICKIGQKNDDDKEGVTEYAQLVGAKMARKLILVRENI
ncbi:arginyl-tRNA--protein transferase 1 [Achroia grisella]|uniref:arginyl-tRNA--protein transferase 1 n=1 Tax=Achroia grisella TaxID=688607 RepID=UPI0027D3248C|nr:arginyl-tRNA--protein transferase 1 [Achroia grisella]